MEPGSPSMSKRLKVEKLLRLSPRTWAQDADLEEAVKRQKTEVSSGWQFWSLLFKSMGVIYGGLGTSPLYVFPNIFTSEPTPEQVVGAMSCIFWTLTIIVVIKYVCVVLRFNDHGEGGTFAVYSLLCRHVNITPFGKTHPSDEKLSGYNNAQTPAEAVAAQRGCGARLGRALEKSSALQRALLLIVLLGTAVALVDGVISPAAAVTSAISGIQVADASLSNGVVMGISVATLLLLFASQCFGTSKLGMAFAPILLLWFFSNVCVGIFNTVKFMPSIFKAFSPYYAFQFLAGDAHSAWVSLSGIVLCITGTEALFADMGHFSRRVVTVGALCVVYPSMVLTYCGNAAYLATHPADYAQAYFRSIPAPVFWPCFVIAIAGALVGSQSLISSAFSIVRQSMPLYCFPRLRVVHTSRSVEGQIYIPAVNWLLCGLGVAVIAGFRSTVAIGHAFGVTVMMVMLITTFLVTIAMLMVFRTNLLLVLAFFLPIFCIEAIYFSSVLYQFTDGGWFPLALAAVLLGVSYVWHWAATLKLTAASNRTLESVVSEAPAGVQARPQEPDAPLQLVASGQRLNRVPGIALYYTDRSAGVPTGYRHLLKSVASVHQCVVFLTIRQVPLPNVAEEQRYLVRELGLPGFFRIICRMGYRDEVAQGPAFVDVLVRTLTEYIRCKALAAKWSAADMYAQDKDPPRPVRRADPVSALPTASTPAAALKLSCASDSLPNMSAEAPRTPSPASTSRDHQPESSSGQHLGGGAHPTASSPAGTAEGPVVAPGTASCHTEDTCYGHAKDFVRPAAVRTAAQIYPAGDEEWCSRASRVAGSVSHFHSELEVRALQQARRDGVTYVLTRSVLRALAGSGWIRRLMLEGLHRTLVGLSESPAAAWQLPVADVLEMTIAYDV